MDKGDLMNEPQSAHPPNVRLSPFTLLATTALAVSNLIVGVLQNNTFLILASAVISGAFAIVYAHKSGMLRLTNAPAKQPIANSDETSVDAAASAKPRFPLWLFLAVIFVLMPAILLFLQTLDQ